MTVFAESVGTRAARGHRAVSAWPLLILALPASVAVWSGWVGIGRMTGFGLVHPLPGIWGSFTINTAVSLPVGVEAYGAYALRAWLSSSSLVSSRTRRFARWSAIGSLLLGMAGQVAYHLLAEAGAVRAPWIITTAVACLPVLVLGMGASLAHMLRADAGGGVGHGDGEQATDGVVIGDGDQGCAGTIRDVQSARLAEAEAVAARLVADGLRLSRRGLRAAGFRGSNAELGALVSRINALAPSPVQVALAGVDGLDESDRVLATIG